MFTRLSTLLGILLAVQSSMPNGLGVSELPSDDRFFEVIAGYRAGIRNETGGTSGLAATISSFLSSSVSGRELTLAAYGTGGEIEFFTELDRTGFRLRVPAWARPMVEPSITSFFSEFPAKDSAGAVRALSDASQRATLLAADFRTKVEAEVRIALLGSRPYHHPIGGLASDLAAISPENVEQFFMENYGTDRAFVFMNGPLPSAFAEIKGRTSRDLKNVEAQPMKAERLLRFPEQESGGAVIFASPVTSVFYRGWYLVLMLDRLIQRVGPGTPTSILVPALDPYYYRLEVPVPAGQFAPQVQDSLLQELERLQFARPTEQNLEQARTRAIEYLESPGIRYWFLSLGIPDRREEGIEWIRAATSDDMRVAARELLLSNRVLASWSPRPRQLRIQTENLNSPSESPAEPPVSLQLPELPPIRLAAFPAHVSHDDPAGAAAGTSDASAMLVFKAWLDRKLIEAGLFNDVTETITGGSRLSVTASDAVQRRVLALIRVAADRAPSEDEVSWAREAAIHRQDLPNVAISDLRRVTAEQVQDMARIHLQN